MTLTKGILGKICKKCEKRFVPTGKFETLCKKCFKESIKKNPRTVIKEVIGDGKANAYMSAWYDFDNEENHL